MMFWIGFAAGAATVIVLGVILIAIGSRVMRNLPGAHVLGPDD